MKKEKEKRRDHISMKGIKNYFKPDGEIVEKKKLTLKLTRSKANARLLKECDWWLKPCQASSSFTFPKTAFGKQNRSCQSRWFTEFNWLDYDELTLLHVLFAKNT